MAFVKLLGNLILAIGTFLMLLVIVIAFIASSTPMNAADGLPPFLSALLLGSIPVTALGLSGFMALGALMVACARFMELADKVEKDIDSRLPDEEPKTKEPKIGWF